MLALLLQLLHRHGRNGFVAINKEAAMLVLSRKVGEEILIGDSVVVTVVRINAQEVRIGVKAPSQVEIVRTELVTASSRDNEPALGH